MPDDWKCHPTPHIILRSIEMKNKYHKSWVPVIQQRCIENEQIYLLIPSIPFGSEAIELKEKASFRSFWHRIQKKRNAE